MVMSMNHSLRSNLGDINPFKRIQDASVLTMHSLHPSWKAQSAYAFNASKLERDHARSHPMIPPCKQAIQDGRLVLVMHPMKAS
jgi:hypothetical protein